MMSRFSLLVLGALTLMCGGYSAFGLTIEGISSPKDIRALGNIYRSVTYRNGENVVYAECDSVEPKCTPSTELITRKRIIPYVEYLKHLADKLSVSSKYLLHHEKALKSFSSYLDTLQGVMKSESVSYDEKAEATQRFNALTRKGGVLDRFTQAVAIKRHLEWEEEAPTDESNVIRDTFERTRAELDSMRNLVREEDGGHSDPNPEEVKPLSFDISYEQSVKQFEQSLWPINFAKILKVGDPTEVFEPSTGNTWKLASAAANRREAEAACMRAGQSYRMAETSDLTYSGAWLAVSALADQIANTDGEKRVWIPGAEWRQGKKVGEVKVDVKINYNTYATRKVAEYQYDVVFRYAVLKERPVYKTTVVDTAEKGDRSKHDDLAHAYGSQSIPAAVLCIKERYRQ